MTQKKPLCNYSGLIKELQTGDTTPGETTTSIGTLIGGANTASTPVDADKIAIRNSVSGLLESLSIADLKTLLSTIYAVVAGKSGGQTLYGGSAQTEQITLIGNGATASGTNIAGGDVNIKARPGTGTGASSLHFFTGTTLTTGTTLQTSSEKMTILGNGNVGIGTTSPGMKLDITGDIRASNYIYTANAKGIAGYKNDGVNATTLMRISATNNSEYYSVGDTIFYNSNVEEMRILNNGNVGIGTTSPTAVLHLKAGTATASTAPLKFTSGANLTTAVGGNMEYNNTFHLTNSDNVRRNVVLSDGTYTAGLVVVGGKVKINIAGTDYNFLVE